MIDCFLLNNENFHEKRNFIFEVKCNPVGKGRPRFARHKNFVKVYTPQKTAEFENIVRNQATILFKNQPLFETPIQVNLIAYFPIPKSFNKRQKQQALNNEIFPTKKPDIDNIVKNQLGVKEQYTTMVDFPAPYVFIKIEGKDYLISTGITVEDIQNK